MNAFASGDKPHAHSSPTPTRRSVIKAAAWSAPVIAAAIATPLAAASQPPKPPLYVCRPRNPYSGDVELVTIEGNTLIIKFKASAQNTVDVTLRLAGHKEIHYNLAREDRYVNNGQAHEKPYKAGGTFTITLPRPIDLATDWGQVQAVHLTDCVVAS